MRAAALISAVQLRTRRDFLSLTGKSLGLAALSSTTVASLLRNVEAASKTIAHLTPEEVATNEDYWATIQNSFSVTRGVINLNNGGVSPSPRIVTEALVRYIWEQEDATAYTMWQALEPQSETIRAGLAELQCAIWRGPAALRPSSMARIPSPTSISNKGISVATTSAQVCTIGCTHPKGPACGLVERSVFGHESLQIASVAIAEENCGLCGRSEMQP